MKEPSVKTRAAVVLLSGGMDSATLLAQVRGDRPRARLHALSFHYGQRHARELQAAAWQAARYRAEHRAVDLSCYGDLVEAGSVLVGARGEVPDLRAVPEAQRDQPPTYVPHRNLVLLSLAAGYAEAAGAAEVFYGAQAQDEYGYWDCTADFAQRLNTVLALNRRQPVRVLAPFVELRKAEVLKIGLALGVDYGHTWTCYRGGADPCGRCPSCTERAAAFDVAGVRDPLVRTAPAG
jgi:7-cyano-7-deazaguanine synthase